ncbi:bZIP transcription factor 29-like isoform X2 [Prosopis cineraria]|nr:bZIP transcription factor 29-like isoform X2 [Prosopis cineraria]
MEGNQGIDPASTGTDTGMQLIGSAIFSSPGATLRPQNRFNAPSPNFNASQMGASALLMQQNFSPENLKPGIPPSHPNIPSSSHYPPISEFQSASQQLRSPNMRPRSSHSRSLSQHSFFSPDCLPPLSPSLYCEPSATPLSNSISPDVSMEESVVNSHGPGISMPVNRDHAFQAGPSVLPRKGHRRSSSDTPLGISGFAQSSPQLVVSPTWMNLENSISRGENSGLEKPIQLVKKELKKDEGHVDSYNAKPMVERKEDVMDDLISVYMNLDNIDNVNLSGAEESKTFESSDNEVESLVSGKTTSTQGATSSFVEERREGIKRSSNGDIAPGSRHRRSFSLDSSIGNLHIGDDSPKLPPLGNGVCQRSPSNSADGKTFEINMELRNGEFTELELKKIMESDKLAEIASSDPKRAKRILANRQSAARSKERKVQYIAELEHKVQTLQSETTTMSTQFTTLQRDNSHLKSENSELKFRLQAMEQQSQLKDALNETLTAEVQRLRLAVTELGGEPILSGCIAARQHAINQQRFQLQHEQPGQLKRSQMQHQPQEETQPQSHQIQHNELNLQPQNDKATAF